MDRVKTPVLEQIWVYPVKSLPGIRMMSAEVDERGFKWDRHWMLVDENGIFVSQRSQPQMALIRVEFYEEGIRLIAGSQRLQLGFDEHDGVQITVQVWQDRVDANHVSDHADQWLSNVLQTQVRLVSFADDVKRPLDKKYAQEDDQTGFSDGFPFLLLGQASIEDLNQRIQNAAMDVKRFRPNLLIAQSEAYEEDSWQRVKIGQLTFRVVKPCSRCKITTLDPQTGEAGAEPLKTLASYRRKGNQVYFGENLVHDSIGTLSEGDSLLVLEKRASATEFD